MAKEELTDLTNLTVEQQYFANYLKEEKIPITLQEHEDLVAKLAQEAGLEIANSNKYSAFWNFARRAITEPINWLTAYLIKVITPQLYVKTATGLSLTNIAEGYGIIRKKAVKAQGHITFSRNTNTGNPQEQIIIKKGTAIETAPINGNVYRLIVDEDTSMLGGVNSIKVKCTAEFGGSGHNLGAGYYCVLPIPFPNIASVTNEANWLIEQGDNEESDHDLRLRVRNTFTAVGNWHTDAKYKAILSDKLNIAVNKIFIAHTANKDKVAAAEIYILTDVAESSNKIIKKATQLIITEGNHGHGDDIKILKFPEKEITISLNIKCNFDLISLTNSEKNANITKEDKIRKKIYDFTLCAFRANKDYIGKVTQVSYHSIFSWSKFVGELHCQFPEIISVNHEHDDLVSGLNIYRIKLENDKPKLEINIS